jgi:glycosyltransferase involved in cell wall biosynthesis
MRILHVGKYYAPERGGIERHLQGIAEWQAAHGVEVRVLVHQRPGRLRSTVAMVGPVEVHRIGCLAAPLYTPLSPTFPIALARCVRGFRPDLLHLHLPNPSAFAALASRAARRLPWIVHWHADVAPDLPDWRMRAAYRVYRPLERAMLARAAAIIATSEPYRDASIALAPWREKTRVIPLGIDAAAHDTQERTTRSVNAPLRLLAVGRLSYYKGFEVLIEALAQVPDARLVLVGHGETETSLRARAQALGVATRVTFAGELDDDALRNAYTAADAFVLPSLDRSEAFGLVLLEAMRARLPVIASAIPGSGVGHVVVDGRTGLLVPPDNAGALVAAIERLRDSALRERLASAGHARWQQKFTLDRSAVRTMELYREVLDRG